jgi:gluconate 2-dehydrogenase gamma chain
MNRREVLQHAAAILGYTITGPALVGILNGCKATPNLAFKPEFFSADQASLVAALTEIIIPRTDTPGAIDAGVPMFIDRILKEIYTKEGQDAFLKGLSDFDKGAQERYNNAFMDCSDEEKLSYFKTQHDAVMDKSGSGYSGGFWAASETSSKPFIVELKELTLLGFFTSEPGATKVLQYNQVPGPFRGCVPVGEVGKTWAT